MWSQWSPQITFITCFVMMFATAIAITKDLPDIEGDKLYNVSRESPLVGVNPLPVAANPPPGVHESTPSLHMNPPPARLSAHSRGTVP